MHSVWLLVTLVLSCLDHKQTLEAKPEDFRFPNRQQETFVSDLENYEIIYPTLRKQDGSFLSHGLHDNHARRMRREADWSESTSDDSEPRDGMYEPTDLLYKLHLFGRDVLVNVTVNQHLIAEGLVIERTSGAISPYRTKCQYIGAILGAKSSVVAISNCGGLEGVIRDDHGEDILIEPVKGTGPHSDMPNPHLIYKPDHMRSRRATDDGSYPRNSCGVNEITTPGKRVARDLSRSHIIERAFRRSARRRRSLSTERFVETLVVVDRAMIEFYQGQSLEQYVLTVMNMVASLYHDGSVGAAVHVVVVRVIIVDSAQGAFTVFHNADRTLEGFCGWSSKVNPPSEYHPQHHDIAILLTRVDICRGMNRPCGTLGLSQVNGLCTKTRSCNINEDSGLSVAYTIAHELGHNFGMEHDGSGNACHNKVNHNKYIMSATQSLSSHPYMWSNCSRHYVNRFLDKGWGWCLDDEPSRKSYKYSTVLPGVIYDFDHQCRMRHGPQSGVCQVQWIQNSDPCSRLWCRFEYENVTTCVMRIKPAADGTYCKEDHWCYRGICVKKSPLPDAVDGGWGPWNGWSPCSRSCGGGVKSKQRRCDSPQPRNGGKFCLGKYKRFKICNSKHTCPEGAPSFRDVQCQQYAVHMYPNSIAPSSTTVKSVYMKDRPCELLCHRSNSMHTIKVAEEAIDGTPCRDGGKDVCIGGKCEPVGCDWKLRSKAKEDKCGICHGDGSQCQTIKSQFNETDLSEGAYVETAFIPAGARNIRVEEVVGAKNYLALKSPKGQFYLNGHWQIQGTGNYKAAGTNIFYSRDKNKDFLRANGPTKEDMHVLLFVQGPNPGVNIEFTIQRSNDTRLHLFYKWGYSSWSLCSAPCGIGERYAAPECKELESGSSVDDTYCKHGAKPEKMVRSCNVNMCMPEWWIGVWQSCSRSCGYGVSKRSIMCIRRLRQDEQLALRDEECHGLERPQSQRLCDSGKCIAAWIAGNWSKCTSECGLGMQHRAIKCSSVNVKLCMSSARKPPSVRLCNGTQCPRWSTGEFKACNVACGIGMQSRPVSCIAGMNGHIVEDDKCDYSTKPVSTEKCAKPPCLKWVATDWGECSKRCGEGTQSRVVFCPGAESQCMSKPKPDASRSCFIKSCSTWKTGPWGKCSKTCVQWRTVICKHSDSYQNAFTCSKAERPDVTRSCRTGLCRTDTAALHHDCRGDSYSTSFCHLVKVAQYCDAPNFKFTCCGTCSGK